MLESDPVGLGGGWEEVIGRKNYQNTLDTFMKSSKNLKKIENVPRFTQLRHEVTKTKI